MVVNKDALMRYKYNDLGQFVTFENIGKIFNLPIDNNTLEEVVLTEENIPVIRDNILETKDTLSSIDDKLKSGEAFFSKAPKNHQESLDSVKSDVCAYLGIEEVPIPHCEYKSFSNSLKVFMELVTSSTFFTTAILSTSYSIANFSINALGTASVCGYLAYKLSKAGTVPVTTDRFIPKRYTITLMNKNFQDLMSSFAHEYTHAIHHEQGLYKDDITRNLSFSEGHARMVEIEISKKYAQEENNEAYLHEPFIKKYEDLANAYVLSCVANDREIEYDILPQNDFSCFINLNKKLKKKHGFLEPHAIGTTYFSVLDN